MAIVFLSLQLIYLLQLQSRVWTFLYHFQVVVSSTLHTSAGAEVQSEQLRTPVQASRRCTFVFDAGLLGDGGVSLIFCGSSSLALMFPIHIPETPCDLTSVVRVSQHLRGSFFPGRDLILAQFWLMRDFMSAVCHYCLHPLLTGCQDHFPACCRTYSSLKHPAMAMIVIHCHKVSEHVRASLKPSYTTLDECERSVTFRSKVRKSWCSLLLVMGWDTSNKVLM